MSGEFDIALSKSWTWSSLKFATSYLSRGTAPDYVDDGRVVAISQASSQPAGLDWKRARFHDFSGDPRKLKGFLLPNDVLINSTGSGTLGRVGYFAAGPGDTPCMADGHITVARALPEVADPRYLYYWLSSTPFQDYIYSALVIGATNQIELNRERLAGAPIALPPLAEQRGIADFLDAETARIDALVKAYEDTLAVLGERVRHVVDLNVEKAGVSVPLKYFVRFREGPGIMAYDFREKGIPLIRISGLQDGVVTLNGANYLDERMVSRQWSQFRLRLGDYLISGSATMGAVSAVKSHDVVGAIPYTGLIILRPATPVVVMEYVAVALMSTLFKRQIDLLKTGATMQHFGPTHLAQVSLPFPGWERQKEIAAAVREVRVHMHMARATISRQLAVLAERRKALIAAAVTGRIDVVTARGVSTSWGGAG